MGRFLGQGAPTATMTYNPSTKIVQWDSSGAGDPEIYVNGTLFARAPSGQQPAPWVTLGDTYLFELKDASGAVLASVYIDTDGTVTGQTIYGGEIPPAEEPGDSWFDQSTDILGVPVPNLAMVGGGGLLLLLLARRKK